ncbi:hypothetical protein SH611_13495 [Geminicoccaceae bacterium 1502E]|nr:hypothetical protein [Geminicoccaceae bacterium 1502E]
MRVGRVASLVAGLALGLAPHMGQAAMLVPGSAWEGASLAENGTGESAFRADAATGEHGFSLRFTPRQGPGSALDAGLAEMLPSLRLSVGLGDRFGAPGDTRPLGLGEALPQVSGGQAGSLVIGGALEWGQWAVGGDFRRLEDQGLPANLVGASLGYGAMRFSLSYGEVERPTTPESSLWLLSTDLATSSWLSLEGDLAVRSRPAEEPDTVGRVGIRLKF